MKTYAVVGVYLEDLEEFIDHVQAETAWQAETMALDQRESGVFICAVFEGALVSE